MHTMSNGAAFFASEAHPARPLGFLALSIVPECFPWFGSTFKAAAVLSCLARSGGLRPVLPGGSSCPARRLLSCPANCPHLSELSLRFIDLFPGQRVLS